MRAYPIITWMFAVGAVLGGAAFASGTAPQQINSWAGRAVDIFDGHEALGVYMLAAAALAIIGQWAERWGRLFGTILAGPLMGLAFVLIWGSVGSYVDGTARISSGFVFGLAGGYFVTYTQACLMRELQICFARRRAGVPR